MCIAFHPKLPSVIAGGTFNGTCGRHFSEFCSLLSAENSHCDYLTSCNMCRSLTQKAILGLLFAPISECVCKQSHSE